MLDVVIVVDDGDDARRASQGVILVVLSQFLKAFGTNYFIWVVPTKWHCFWHIFWHAIWHSHFISYIFCNSFWHSIWYIFGDSLWLRSGGQHSDHKVWCFCCCCCCWCCCCCCYPCSFFLSHVVAKNHQIGCVCVCVRISLRLSEQKNTVNIRKYQCFFAPRKPKSTVFTMLFAFGSKNHGIYSVFWTAPSKNTGIYAVFSMLQEVLFPCQRHKNT